MNLPAYIGRYAANSRLGPLARPLLARPFRRGHTKRCAILFEPDRISYAQVYPFVLYAREIEARYGVQLRFFDIRRLDRLDFADFDEVIFQLWFTREAGWFDQVFEKAARGGAKLRAFLDSFAHNDLRLAARLDGQIDYYLKKSLFRDVTLYSRPTRGHTNLTDHYQRAFGIADEEVRWDIPPGFTDKLRLSPNFFTAPHLYRLFLDQDVEQVMARRRDIDLHARLGRKGSAWYVAMRDQALAEVQALAGVRVASNGLVSPKEFAAEMDSARMCFSPFGFGELCWRDIEAMAAGAVLLKPAMDHLRSLPDLYEPHVTYVPLAWDCSDLAEKVAWVSANPAAADAMARAAFIRIRDYLTAQRFVKDMEFLFT